MNTTRLEAFSDAVIAIIMTLMVLELRVPEGTEMTALQPLLPIFLSYVMSYVYLGIYWNNHHHLLHATDHVDGRILWANIFLLFWLSLTPFTTEWMAENNFAPIPTALYGLVLLCSAIAYTILSWAILKHEDTNQELRDAIGKDWKGKLSLLLYVVGFASAMWNVWIAVTLYAAVAIMWLVPDPRIERAFGHH